MNKECAIYQITNFIGKRWALIILLELYKGNKVKRYSELKKSINYITPKMLSLRLKELEKEKLLIKKVYTNTTPNKCEYFLTKKGEGFIKIIKSMKTWSLKWKKNNFCQFSDCKNCKL